MLISQKISSNCGKCVGWLARVSKTTTRAATTTRTAGEAIPSLPPTTTRAADTTARGITIATITNITATNIANSEVVRKVSKSVMDRLWFKLH